MKKSFILLGITLLLGGFGRAQSFRPFESWLGTGIEQRFDYGLLFRIESQEWLSSSSESPTLKHLEISPTLTWLYSPRYDFFIGYERATDWSRDQESESSNTSISGFTTHLPWGKWRLDSRQRFDTGTDDENELMSTFRHQARLSYSGLSKRWRPYLANEWFLELSSGILYENRSMIGIEYQIHDSVGIDLYALRRDQIEENTYSPVLGINLNLSF